MPLRLTAAEARATARAVHVFTAVHEFDSLEAWRSAVSTAARHAFRADRVLMQLPPCRVGDAPNASRAACFVGHELAPEIVTRCETFMRVRPGSSDDPAAADIVCILAACAAARLETWTGPSFLAATAGRLGAAPPVRHSAFVREIIEPSGLWHGPHLRARAGGFDAVLGLSRPRPGGCHTEESALLLAGLLQPAWAAGVHAAYTRWGVPHAIRRADPPARASAVISPRVGAPTTLLTAREQAVAALLTVRRTNREIAEALGMSEHTARHHTEGVLRKLGLRSRRAVPPID